MTKIGAHALIWAPGWSTPEAEHVISKVAAAGFNFVEIPLMRPEAVDVTATRSLLAEYGLSCTTGLGLPAAAHLPFAPKRAEEHLNRAVDVAAALGSPILTGGLYTHLGARTGNPPSEEELATVAGVLKRVARRAAGAGMRLGIENINRYETYLANRVSDVLDLIARIGEPNVVAHIDTYHANIEENGFAGPLRAAGGLLGYVHLSESGRQLPGTGNVRFAEVFSTLAAIGYTGPLVIESFAPLSDEVTATFALWHDPVGDPDDYGRAGLAWFQEMADRHGLPDSQFGPFAGVA